MSGKTVGILDYGMGNLFSVRNVCETLGADVEIVQSPRALPNCHALILPGVGAFADAAASLKETGLWTGLLDRIKAGVPFLGICLGMQLLFEKSTEFGESEGLGLFPGHIEHLRALSPGLRKVPEVGWNTVNVAHAGAKSGAQALRRMEGQYFYFVHSFAARMNPGRSDDFDIGTTTYDGAEFVSVIAEDNVLGVQFHPERSGEAGLEFYQHWLKSAAAL